MGARAWLKRLPNSEELIFKLRGKNSKNFDLEKVWKGEYSGLTYSRFIEFIKKDLLGSLAGFGTSGVSVEIFTEYVQGKAPDGEAYRYRAHPFAKGSPWQDWAFVDVLVPCHLLAFLELSGLPVTGVDVQTAGAQQKGILLTRHELLAQHPASRILYNGRCALGS